MSKLQKKIIDRKTHTNRDENSSTKIKKNETLQDFYL